MVSVHMGPDHTAIFAASYSPAIVCIHHECSVSFIIKCMRKIHTATHHWAEAWEVHVFLHEYARMLRSAVLRGSFPLQNNF